MFKKLCILAAAVAAVASSAPANAAINVCADMEGLASKIMQSRQLGVSMAKLMGIADENRLLGPAMRQMIILAYEEPRWSTDENQQKAIEDFANKISLACYQAK